MGDPQATSGRVPVVALVREGVEPITRVGRLLLSGQPSSEAFEGLVEDGVTVVIDLRRAEEERGFDEPGLIETLGARYESAGFGGPEPLTDDLFDRVRTLLSEHRSDGSGDLLLHCASSNRVGAVWLTTRVLDERVAWDVALEEAHRVGLSSEALEEAARNYVLGAGNQDLGAFKAKLRGDLPEVPVLSVEELSKKLEEGAGPLLLDARALGEFNISHLPGARHAPDVDSALAAIGDDPGREVVVYCSIGYRSGHLARALGERGIAAQNLEGSIFEWANSGHSVVRDGKQVEEVHPFDAEWGRMLDRELWSEFE